MSFDDGRCHLLSNDFSLEQKLEPGTDGLRVGDAITRTITLRATDASSILRTVAPATGGRWAEEGMYKTPDTQVAVYEFDDMVMTFEMTLNTPYMILADQELRDSDMFPHWPQNSSRIEIFGTKGLMILGRHGMGWQVFGWATP